MTLHADARRALDAWTPPTPGQAALRRHYIDHLHRHHDAMWRECRPDHLTASALIVDHAGTQVLLTLHTKIGRWLQTGGHCERGDRTLAAAALREAREESGIVDLRLDPGPVQLSYHEVPCGPVRPAHHLDVQFVAVAVVGATAVCSAESDDVKWFPVQQLPASTDETLRDLVRRAMLRLRPVGTEDGRPA